MTYYKGRLSRPEKGNRERPADGFRRPKRQTCFNKKDLPAGLTRKPKQSAPTQTEVAAISVRANQSLPAARDSTFFRNKSCQAQQLDVHCIRPGTLKLGAPSAQQRNSFFRWLKNFSSHRILTIPS